MTHKAFELIGQRILIVDRAHRNKEGIFQESERFQTTAEGAPRPALDFIEPVYNPNFVAEEFAKGLKPRDRINPDNPILSVHCGIDQLKLRYRGRKNNAQIFEGELDYVQAALFNDGNFEVYNKYRAQLKRAGFKID